MTFSMQVINELTIQKIIDKYIFDILSFFLSYRFIVSFVMGGVAIPASIPERLFVSGVFDSFPSLIVLRIDNTIGKIAARPTINYKTIIKK